MQLSENGKNLIKSFEGCRLEAYLCPANVWTIGWGHTGSSAYPGNSITQSEADKLFNDDIVRYEYPVRYYDWLNQNQYDALVSFTYNCGSGALEDVMTSGDITGTMALYKKGGGIVLPGLVRRREAEINLFNTPVQNEEIKETRYLMENCICFCNEIDKVFADNLGKLLNWHVIDARISMDYTLVKGKIVAVGADNPKKGQPYELGFSGYTTDYIKGKDRAETSILVNEFAKNNK